MTVTYQLKEWAKRIAARAQSGRSIKAWCGENNISVRMYYYWLKKVRECAASFMNTADGKLAEGLSPGTQLSPPAGWAVCAPPVEPAKALPPASLTIEIGSCRVTADNDVSAELLSKVCKVLVELC